MAIMMLLSDPLAPIETQPIYYGVNGSDSGHVDVIREHVSERSKLQKREGMLFDGSVSKQLG